MAPSDTGYGGSACRATPNSLPGRAASSTRSRQFGHRDPSRSRKAMTHDYKRVGTSREDHHLVKRKCLESVRQISNKLDSALFNRTNHIIIKPEIHHSIEVKKRVAYLIVLLDKTIDRQ
jgi:hypothetical protein